MDLKRAQLLSDPAAEEEAEEDELELSLELSLGRRSSKLLHVSDSGMESGKASVDLCSGDPGLAGSEALSAAAPLLNLKLNVPSSKGEPHQLDSQQWRMLHALRRKREEQQQRKVTASQRGNGLVVPPFPSFSADELTVLEAQEAQFQCRSSDREARERDSFWAEQRSSGHKIPDNVFIPSSNSSQNSMPNGNGNTPAVLPMVPVRCQQVQYVPIVNGSGSPYMMPCCAPVVSRRGNSASSLETNVFHPVPYRGFNLFPVPAASTNSTGVDTKPTRSGSPGSSSSSMSNDEYRGSLQVGSSNGCSGRNPSHSSAGKPELQTSQFSCSIPYNQMGAGKRVSNSVQASLGSNDKLVSITTQASMVSNSPSLLPGKIERAASVNKPVSMAAEEPQDETSLPRMPRVSTTGDGPNGKTITGFLYRYDKSEVSIVCVCHGSSFSPAEFVRHAGGTNVANPLRRIVVVPS